MQRTLASSGVSSAVTSAVIFAVIVTIQALPSTAQAHVSVASGPAFANVTQEVVFGVAHGCAGTDTYHVRVEIPDGVTSVRPMTSDFGRTSVEKDAAGTVVAVSWQRADADMLDADLNYYKLVARLKAPDKPFTTLYFKARQTCRAMDGTLAVVDWAGLPSDPLVDGGAAEPAPALRIVPARQPGWNSYVVAGALSVADIGAFFADALIVWKDAAAYSANPTTTNLIKATPGVSVLGSLASGDTIWARY